MVWNTVGALAAACAVLLIGVFLFQSRLVFFPSIGREYSATPRGLGLEFEGSPAALD